LEEEEEKKEKPEEEEAFLSALKEGEGADWMGGKAVEQEGRVRLERWGMMTRVEGS
jgi:hypothetical protein